VLSFQVPVLFQNVDVSDEEEKEEKEEKEDEEKEEQVINEWPLGKFETSDEEGLSELEAMLFVLDQMQIHKSTDEQGKGFWDIMQASLGPQFPMSSWNTVKGVIDRFYNVHVERISICVNDCVAFWDPKYTPALLSEKHAHRNTCPKCGQDRSKVVFSW
jgi:hypothetical protein